MTALLSGCGQTPAPSAPPASPPAAATLINCDFEISTAPSPQRVVTIKSTPLELMLALGLADRVVGSAMLDGPVPDELAPSDWKASVISEELPSRELLLAAEPDFVFAGWASNLGSDGIGTREELLSFGIRSYVAPPACTFGADSAEPLDFDDIFEMFSEIGTIFEAETQATALIEEQRARLAAIDTPSAPRTALWFSSGDDTPFVGGGSGAPNMIMQAAGLTSLTADEPQSWFSMPWESFVASDPDVIVLVDAPWNSAQKKQDLLEGHPAASTMSAVKAKSYIVVSFATTEAGVRNVEAVEAIATALQAQ